MLRVCLNCVFILGERELLGLRLIVVECVVDFLLFFVLSFGLGVVFLYGEIFGEKVDFIRYKCWFFLMV